MHWYVFALVDEPPARMAGRGFASPIVFKELPGCFAAAERRADVPPVEMGALKDHDRVVTALWKRVPAILPVRFGTLVDLGEVRELLTDRDEEIAEAFDGVRGKAQFTWRRLRESHAKAPRAASGAASGTEYLRRAAGDPVPARYAGLRKALGRYIAGERFQPGAAPRPERLYHLVANGDTAAYASAGRALASRAGLAFSGPWPPYAFAPEIL